MSQSQPPLNPYEPPREAVQAYSPVYQAGNLEHFTLLKQFRQQIHALAGFWIFIGCLSLAICIFVAATSGNMLGMQGGNVVMMMILGIAAIIWLSIGVATCFKQIWAVYLGLGLSYLSVIGNLINLNVCGLIILGAVILQAHRVLGFAKRLQGLGIPLTTRLNQLTMQVTPTPGQWPS
ncbi:MAG: hypothetical protein K8R36_06185 [Planctomycetales bacterium]|nr:hypothetical protein [Planctomycetales bacterium]